jgi:hypothetical protein
MRPRRDAWLGLDAMSRISDGNANCLPKLEPEFGEANGTVGCSLNSRNSPGILIRRARPGLLGGTTQVSAEGLAKCLQA